jgi:hypothetical protein
VKSNGNGSDSIFFHLDSFNLMLYTDTAICRDTAIQYTQEIFPDTVNIMFHLKYSNPDTVNSQALYELRLRYQSGGPFSFGNFQWFPNVYGNPVDSTFYFPNVPAWGIPYINFEIELCIQNSNGNTSYIKFENIYITKKH